MALEQRQKHKAETKVQKLTRNHHSMTLPLTKEKVSST